MSEAIPLRRPRVVVADDDEWLRRGQASALRERPEVELVAEMSLADAARRTDWSGVDVVLVDAYDDGADWDRFRGVRAVEQIRAMSRSTAGAAIAGPATACPTIVGPATAGPTIVVVTGHVLNDVLRLRMAEAGANYYFGRGEIRDVETLVRVIVRPGPTAKALGADEARLARIGLSVASRPNAALAYVRARRLEDVFVPGAPQKVLPVNRRTLITARGHIASLAGLRSREAGTGAVRPRGHVPSWREVSDFVNRARGVERRFEP